MVFLEGILTCPVLAGILFLCEFGWPYKRRLNHADQIYPSRGRGRDSVTV